MKPLPTEFNDRSALVEYVASITSWLEAGDPSPIRGSTAAAEKLLRQIEPEAYARSRNHLDGAVTQLSPYIRHGMVSLNAVRNEALRRVSDPLKAEKLIQELTWREFWQRIYVAHPDWIWNDVESYKTGWQAEDYAPDLPEDIRRGQTGVACIDQFCRQLCETGYLHNHARMYLAAYVVHWRRIRWQAGARWFLHHLIDGDPASNNLSWQWVASTFSSKPYIFNLENVQKYAAKQVDCLPEHNQELDASYDTLSKRLFPHLGASHG